MKSPRLPPTDWKTISVYLEAMQDTGAYYKWKTGNIILNTIVANDDEARYEAAHELFHRFQNASHDALAMSNRQWFVEASASHGGAYLATGSPWIEGSLKNTACGYR